MVYNADAIMITTMLDITILMVTEIILTKSAFTNLTNETVMSVAILLVSEVI